ncbi:cyclase family protein [Halocola ammonii]
MIATIKKGDREVKVDLSKPIDISLLLSSKEGALAWYVDPVSIEPVMTEQFTGSVKLGGSVNFRDIKFNPHGNGTHTECVGHISHEEYSINQTLKNYFHWARLISVQPEVADGSKDGTQKGDRIITADLLKEKLKGFDGKAIVIRTLPNDSLKKTTNYSNTNPAYLTTDAIQAILDAGADHLLLDLPSVDREEDGGALAAHHLFWNYPSNPNLERTITELIFVPDEVKDGDYLLEIQFAPFENDASPSRPVLYSFS